MKDCLYRIATSEAGLSTGYFVGRGLPMPDLVNFADFTNRRPQSTGGQARQGYTQMSLFWNRLDANQANTIKELIDTAETSGGSGNGTLYLTIPRTDAPGTGITWIDISGIVLMPGWESTQQGSGQTYENVQLQLNNCTVQNEPASF